MGTLNHPTKITKFYLLKISAPIFLSNLAIPLVGIVDTGLGQMIEGGEITYIEPTDIIGKQGKTLTIDKPPKCFMKP